jgi:hypothetical protein
MTTPPPVPRRRRAGGPALVNPALFLFRGGDGYNVTGQPVSVDGKPSVFARTSTGTAVDSAGRVYTAPAGVARRNVIGAENTLLLEPQRTNLALHSRDIANAAWVKTNLTAVRDVVGADGAANAASRLTATAGNATALQAITSASAERVTGIRIRRLVGTGAIEVTQDNGATWTPVTVTAGWTRVSIPPATLANPTVGIRVVTSGDSIAVDYFQHETAMVLSSDIPTEATTVTRNADSLYWEVPGVVPQELTLYLRLVQQATLSGIAQNTPLLMIGSSGNTTTDDTVFIGTRQTNNYRVTLDSGGTERLSSGTAGASSVGDVVELRATISAAGVVQLHQSTNSAAEVSATASSPLALPSAWANQRTALTGNQVMAAGRTHVLVARGTLTRAQCRALAGVTT